MKLTYPACFYPCEQKKGGFTVEVPDLPGCVSEGSTLAEAILMGTDAASG
ncbi:MAG: type II toxin-antitoxin system HicB family antitoxin, partial [Lachnospiraceae bacterium]|nr:type II toxin-antitoxin system HicB family antitoxin [Lachnospiraceae bacterium]